MKKLLFLASLFIISISTSVLAQTDADVIEMTRSLLKLEKKAAVAEAMILSEDEALIFWPLYEEYNGKLYQVQNKRIKIMSDFGEQYEGLTNEQADELMNQFFAYQSQLFKLKKQYYKKFKKILPQGKAARYMQIENKVETLIDAQLAVELPLIETK